MFVKPPEQEADYFARVEIERRKQTLAAQESLAAEEERNAYALWPSITVPSVARRW